MKLLPILLLGLSALDAVTGWALLHDRPQLGILPPIPYKSALRAQALGDEQFLYRSTVLDIQNAGDTGGRVTPMREFDVEKVVSWMSLLQDLDRLSNHYPMLAVRYFAQVNRPDELRRLVEFVDRDVDLAPARKWYWQTQIVAIARDRIKDLDLALALSRKLARFADFVPPDMFWVLQVEPILLFDLGRFDEARTVMDGIVARHGGKMNPYERDWTRTFYARLGNR
ncbi:MAG: hypothetical protein KDE14_14220 [Rhodobacteraceae bacterium]|nr:hypothetical protein [Paracoccaceae bacterium]